MLMLREVDEFNLVQHLAQLATYVVICAVMLFDLQFNIVARQVERNFGFPKNSIRLHGLLVVNAIFRHFLNQLYM
jgi:hypothetical protein